MSVMYLVLPLAFLVAGIAVFAFAWAAKRGEFDDLDTPPLRAILDDDQPPAPPADAQKQAANNPAKTPAGEP